MEQTLLDFVLAELSERKGTWPEICNTVPGIDYSWLSKLANGQIPDPSVRRIQRLADYFRGIVREPKEKVITT